MIAAEFISELRKIRTLFEWKLVADTNWKSERRGRPRFHVRATSKDLTGGVLFEPIGALCYIRTGLAYGADAWLEAATAIGLSEADAWQITAAANDLTWRQVGRLRGPNPQVRSLRSQLAAAVELEIEAPDQDPAPGFLSSQVQG